MLSSYNYYLGFITRKGAVYIDSYDVSKVELGSIRRQVGIVPQTLII